MTTPNATVAVQRPPQLPQRATVLMIWQAIVGVACLYGATQILQLDDFFNLGSIVKVFLAVVVALTGVAAIISIPLILRLRPSGRFIGMALNFAGMVLALIYLGDLLGLYLGFDVLAEKLASGVQWLYAIALGYLVVWLGNRFDENSNLNLYFVRGGLGIMGLALILMLLSVGVLDSFVGLFQNLFQVQSLAVVGIVLLFGTTAYLLLKMGYEFGETIAHRETWQGWLFLMPNFVNFTLFFAMPLLLSFYISFTNYDAMSRADFIGLQNYQEMLSLDFQIVGDTGSTPQFRQDHFEIVRIGSVAIGARDPLFWRSLGNTIRYCVMLLLISIIPALGLAMLLNSKIPGMKMYRALFFVPSIAAVVGVSLIWQSLYHSTSGVINYVIGAVIGFLNTSLGANIAIPRIEWLTDGNILLISVVIMAAWQVIGFNTVIFLAGLQNIPREIMEAATVDGAGRWTKFRKIMLPMIAPTTFFVTVTTLIAGLQMFTESYVLVGSVTSDAKLSTVYYLYNKGFTGSPQQGYASATAWVLFVFIFAVTLIQFRFSSNDAYSD